MQVKPGASLTVYAVRVVNKSQQAWDWPIESFHLTRKAAEDHVATRPSEGRYRQQFSIVRMHLIYRKGGWFRINALPLRSPALDQFAQTVYAPEERHPVLFNPYTGTARDPADIESDPFGMLILAPDQPLRSAEEIA